MTAPRHPAAFLITPDDSELAYRRAAVTLAGQQDWPAPRIYVASPAEAAAAADRLAAVIGAGRHDALVMTVPADTAAVARLLQACTKAGVLVSFLPRPGAGASAGAGADAAGDAATSPAGSASTRSTGMETWDTLARARLEALSELFPAWRIWLDRHGWHARRRNDGFVQSYRPGAPAFYVRATTATDLAAQLCWQNSADEHAPDGCQSVMLQPPPWQYGPLASDGQR